ncbi:hypothetical protein TRAPUB_10480 [Trametes pubescens]|uniref:Fe2OG dioxygenase domain-containing protein n=1 Tax=Trametes pubescens TaxID=154538 RepID=A0A1M2VZN5_TRAPU|nr:hypothetical protein TRAPUB_10480 [Trametes pubescens]
MSLVQAAQDAESAEAFDQIPIIDLKDIDDANPETKKALGKAVRDACINVGFLYVRNHGIPEETIDKALSASKEFFSLPLDQKIELDIRKASNFKGYNAILTSNNDPLNRGDLHEGFEFGWEELDPRAADDKRANDGAMAGANVWPSELPGFRESVLSYYHAAVDLGRKLFPLFALALDLPEDFFADKCFTILWQEPGIQALQVLNKQNQWIDAPPIPGTLVVNIADQFARWTNDVFKSTVHRAINRSGVRRYSIPLFFGTDYDVKLEVRFVFAEAGFASLTSPVWPSRFQVASPRRDHSSTKSSLQETMSRSVSRQRMATEDRQ